VILSRKIKWMGFVVEEETGKMAHFPGKLTY
jgi:hypothetical protein